ncbi:MAG: thioredoxin [Coriobacteriales bacterium]|nr:thioredoxin [Coriobacteriales bacterium]
MAIQKITAENFQSVVLNSDKPVFVDFSATWCGPCKVYHPTFEAFAEANADKARFAEVDIDECSEVAFKYGINAVPTTVIFSGGEPVDHVMGAVNEYTLNILLDRVLM